MMKKTLHLFWVLLSCFTLSNLSGQTLGQDTIPSIGDYSIHSCSNDKCGGMYSFTSNPSSQQNESNNFAGNQAAGCKRVKVYFVKPGDVAYDADRVKYCDIAMREIQQQWASQGKTMYVEKMVYVETNATVSEMLNNGGYFTYAIDNVLVPQFGLANGNHKVMLFVDGIGGNGAGGGDYAGAPVWAIDGFVNLYENNDAGSAGMPGLIGHELGHAFGVYHEDGSPDNGSVPCEEQCIPKGIMCNGGSYSPCGEFNGYPQVRINDWHNGYFNQYPDYFNETGGSCNGPEFIWDTDYPNIEFNKEYIIRSKGSNKVLSIDNGNLVQKDYTGAANQLWIITPEQYGLNTPNYIRYSQIINAGTGQAADNYNFNTDIGGNLVAWGSNGQTNQQWRLINRNGDYVIQNMASGWVMDVQGNSYDENANIHQWEWNEGNNQLWRFENPCASAPQDSDNDGVCDLRDQCPNFDDALIGTSCNDNDPYTEKDIWEADCTCRGQKIIPICTGPNFTYRLTNVNSGKILEVGGNSTDNGGNIQQWDFANTNSQKWYFQKIDDTQIIQYTLTNFNSGKVIEVGGNNTQNGGNVQQWDFANTNSQKWIIEEVENGQFVLTNANSGKVLEVAGNNTDNGANVQQWEYANSNSQKWQIELVDGNCIPPIDTDGDGILDAEDSCPNLNNDLIGTACNDNNPNTENDIYQSNCNCEGTPIVGSSKIQAKVFLEGFFDGTNGLTKNTDHATLIPNNQPFNTAPWNYNGNESASAIPANAVDWILLATRDANGNILEQKAGFISTTGEIMDTDGSMGISVNNASTYFSIHHKSHLAVMSSSAYTSEVYNFTNNINQAIGTEQMAQQGGKFMMYSGDYDCNGIINNIDYNSWKTNSATLNQYLNVDGDGNGIINNLDYNLWKKNRSKIGHQTIQF